MRVRRLVRAWGPVVVWMAVIFLLSSRSTLPKLPDATADRLFKKGGHVVEYGILAGLCWRALQHTGPRRHAAAWAFAITAIYAGSDEWHQTFVPGRNGQPLDVLIDGSGALIGLAVTEVWRRNRSGAGSAREPAPDQTASSAGTRDPEVADGA